jgi:hypothetical protein
MTDPLEGIRLKIKRAERHGRTLQHKINTWFEQEEATLIHHHDPYTGEHLFYPSLPEPPLEWGILLGDLLHNLRSALDHLVWQLVIRNGVMPPAVNKLAFPIVSDPARYPTDGGAYLIGAHRSVIDRIEREQPYNRRRGSMPHQLEVLATFSNIDKHRTLHPVTMVTTRPDDSAFLFRPLDAVDQVIPIIYDYIDIPIHEAVVFAVKVVPPTANVYVKPQQPLPTGIAFGEGAWKVPMEQLPGIATEVRRIVDLFEPAVLGNGHLPDSATETA